MDWNNQLEFPSPFFEPIYRIETQAERITEKKAVLMEPVDSTAAFTQAPSYKAARAQQYAPRSPPQSISKNSAGELAA